jgi:hypothetical protein
MDDPNVDKPLVLKVLPPGAAASSGALRKASDLQKYTDDHLKTATYLIPDLTLCKKADLKQVEALIGAIARRSGRKLPLKRDIQISGSDPREEELIVVHVAAPINNDLRPLPVSMISDMTRLLDHESLIMLMPPIEILEVGTFLTIAYTNAGSSYIRQYKVMEQLPSISLTTTQWGLAAVIMDDGFEDPSLDVVLDEDVGSNLLN